MKRIISIVTVIILFTLCATAQAAPSYPSRPIRLYTQAPPGSALDVSTRHLATMLGAELGQPVLVSNQPGAGGNVATNMLLAAPADGYTLCTTGSNPFADNFFLLKVRYKYEDLAPISIISLSRMGIITQPDRPWQSLRDAFAEAKEKDVALKLAFMDPRSREAMETLAAKEGVKLALVPQQGGTPTLTAVMGGHVDLGIVGSILVESTKAGKIKTIAITGDDRMTQLPEISTLIEQGYDVSFDSPIVLFAKSGVPDDIIEKLSTLMEKIQEDPEYKRVIVDIVSSESMPAGREYAQKLLKESYNRIAKEKGAKVMP